VLIEKAFTTPEQYPLSLNALTNGSNQKSNRDPVVDYMEAELVVALQGLTMKGLAGRVTGAGSRVEKFRHNGLERLGVDEAGLAVLAELLMRGPQAPGELRARVNRMVAVPTLEALGAHLEALEAQGYVRRLPPAPGSRAERVAQLLAPGLHAEAAAAPSPAREPAVARAPAGAGSHALADPAPVTGGLAGRVAALEGEVALLRRQLERLARDLGAEVE